MKTFKKSFMLLAVLALSLISCDWDTSPEPDHPTYITYTISAITENFNGPSMLQSDMEKWIKKNTVIYYEKTNTLAGNETDYARNDPEALKKYEAFKSTLSTFLSTGIKAEIDKGTYGVSKDIKAQGTFQVYVDRDGSVLKSEKMEFSYP